MKTAYLVRLRHAFRVRRADHDAPYIILPDTNQAVFLTRAAAERFAATHRPARRNPFDTRYGYYKDLQTGTLHFSPDGETAEFESGRKPDTLSEIRTIPLSEWNDFFAERGIPVPPETMPDDERTFYHSIGSPWWDEVSSHLTEDQITAVWEFVFPNPFEIIELPFDEE